MYDLNKVMLIGRLTKDPEIRTTPSGTRVANFSMAMTMSKNKDTGEQKTEFVNLVAWEGLAEIIDKYVPKGTLVYVEGYLQTSSWEGQDGKKNYKTEIVAKELKILTPKNFEGNGGQKNSNYSSRSTPKEEPEELPEIDLDEIVTPF